MARVGKEKLIQTLPRIQAMSRIGNPADWKVNSSTRMTNREDRMEITRLSLTKEDDRSRELVELPTT